MKKSSSLYSTLITVNIGKMLEILICIASLVSMVSAHKLLNTCNVESSQKKSRGPDGDQPSEELEAAEEHDYGFDQFSDEEEIDIDTFVMPPRPDCSICMLPLPFEDSQYTLKSCCGYSLCRACDESSIYGGIKRGIDMADLFKCPFCRENQPKDVAAALNILVERGNSNAMHLLPDYCAGSDQNPLDVKRGIELYHMSARAGNSKACYDLGFHYWKGAQFDNFVLKENRPKAMRLFARGAKLGDLLCLYKIGVMRHADGKEDCHRYYLAAASAGRQEALDKVKEMYVAKAVTKEDYANALRSFQGVHNEIDSVDRKRFNKRLDAGVSLMDIRIMSPQKKEELVKAGILCYTQCKKNGRVFLTVVSSDGVDPLGNFLDV